MSNRVQRRRLAKYKRRKDVAVAKKQMGEFMKWSLRFHQFCHRLYGPPNLWR